MKLQWCHLPQNLPQGRRRRLAQSHLSCNVDELNGQRRLIRAEQRTTEVESQLYHLPPPSPLASWQQVLEGDATPPGGGG